jgi:hypothetical protein
MDQINLRNLRLVITNYFSLEELRAICFDLGVDFDDIPGKGKSAKSLELVAYLNIRSRLDELIQLIDEERPQLALDEMLGEGSGLPQPPPDDQNEVIQRYGRELKRIERSLGRGQLVPFIGADWERDLTGLPSRQEMADSLAREEGLESGQSFPAVAQLAVSQGSRFDTIDHVRESLNDPERKPQQIHRWLVGLVRTYQVKNLITTGYDDLLAQAFRQADFNVNRVVNDANLRFISPAEPTLIQLFGQWQQPTSLVISEQDISALVRGRVPDKGEVVDYVRQLFRSNSMLFIGYNLADTAVNILFDEIAGGQFQQQSFAIWSGLSDRAAESWQNNRGLTVIDTDPVLFLQTLLR